MKRFALLMSMVAVSAPCHHGMTTATFAPAQAPAGVAVRVTIDQAEFAGELLEMRDSGLVILTSSVARRPPNGGVAAGERKVRLLPYTAVRSARFAQMSSRYSIDEGRAPAGEVRERLRLLSRFPRGVTADVLQQLLQACGQTELAGVVP